MRECLCGPPFAQVFEETVALEHEPQLVANWVTGEYARFAARVVPFLGSC